MHSLNTAEHAAVRMMMKWTLVLVLSLISTTAMAQIPPPMSVCQKEGLEHDFVQAFCRLPNVPDCSEAPDKDPKQFGCYMRCDDDKLNAAEKLYKCEDHDMVCYHQVTCILPPKKEKSKWIVDEGW